MLDEWLDDRSMTGGTPEIRSDKSFTSLTFDQWSNGPMDQCTNGPMVQWFNGPMVQWTNGPMDQWTNGPRDQGTNGQWTMDKKILRSYEKKNTLEHLNI